MTPWLSVLGVGEDGLDSLPAAARALIDSAEVVIGQLRHLELLKNGDAERLTWASPLSCSLEAIAERRGRRVVVLATGDPMFYGIGATLARRFTSDEMTVIPGVGAFGLVCARMSWPAADVEAVTLHGRPLALLNLHMLPGARLVILSEDGETPRKVAEALTGAGFDESTITVFEHLGGPTERRIDGTARNWPADAIADLNTMAVDCRAGPDAIIRPRVPGLPDEAFENDGQLTKREVRAVTLAALGPVPRALLWDVGAGSGSIGIEWLRAEKTAQAIAVERDPARAARIARNALMLGVPRLEITVGEAPQALNNLPRPQAVFIGGGTSNPDILEAAFRALLAGGTFVANAVTVEGGTALLAFRERFGGELKRISISRLEP
ncbi:MAG: precorrin-6y C5,15-methyltransferase (decarboxylating) subunit CbiE, partial [Alphaproteobacteria bacterium]